MKNSPRPLAYLAALWLIVLALAPVIQAAKPEPIPLTPRGEKLLTKFQGELEILSADIASALPSIDPVQKQAFLDARDTLAKIQPLGEDATAKDRSRHAETTLQAETKTIDCSRDLIKGMGELITGDTLDSKLMKAAILVNATPRGLAEFAQQGTPEEKLLDQLFADEPLMKQILTSGGANGGEYGEAMQVYQAILAKSEKAREVGTIFQRLALGTAIHMPWLQGKDQSKGGIHNIVYRTQKNIDQVERYLHYEKAFLDGELDPAFKDFNTWECRFITNDPYSNEDLAWLRKMMRTYRPDHISNPDYKWRYIRIVKSDVPYISPTSDPALGTPAQQHIALGGICGRRAYYGRLSTRAFGIPSRASTQTGHGAMNHWTPDGWVVCFGAWWSMAWCGPQGGLDFLLDSQAREHSKNYLKVLRAQWIGDALGEKDVSIRHYGEGGGYWDALAFYQKRAIVKDAKVKALELAGGMKLGESDELLGDEKGDEITIPEADRTIITAADGSITIPAAACDRPKNSTDKVAFMKSWGGGTQIHYARLGNRPELIRYTVEVPTAGKYQLVAKVATVSDKQTSIIRLNRRTIIDMPLPYTKGLWQQSEPVTLELREGRNTLMFTCRAPNRGVSIKELRLQPSK